MKKAKWLTVLSVLVLVFGLASGCSTSQHQSKGQEATSSQVKKSKKSKKNKQTTEKSTSASAQSSTAAQSSSSAQSGRVKDQNAAATKFKTIATDVVNRMKYPADFTAAEFTFQESQTANGTAVAVMENHRSAKMKAHGADAGNNPVIANYLIKKNGELYYLDVVSGNNYVDTGKRIPLS